MISGAHSIIYSKDPDADREFFQKILKLAHVDAGEGWLIFGFPPSELGIHPGKENNVHELYLLSDDIHAFVSEMEDFEIACSEVQNVGWGLLTQLSLPGGGQIGVYQPRHARPPAAKAKSTSKKSAKPAKKKAVKKVVYKKKRK